MTRKTDIKKCRYNQCVYSTKDIDIAQDEYVVKGSTYFHKDCYEKKVNGELESENKKKDIQFIKTLWIENINRTVVCSQLYSVLNELIDRGVELDYLIFALQYCIKHKLNLNYPYGFPYFVDKKVIKDAYKKKKLTTNNYNQDSFKAVENDEAFPKFTINKKASGFQSILKNRDK